MKKEALIIGFMLLGLSYLLAQDELELTVLSVEGQAQYKEPGEGKEWKKLEAGVALKKGYQIQTGLRSKALLRFSDATKIAVKSATFLEITEAMKQKDTAIGQINVDIGSLRIQVEKERKENVDLKVTTPHGTASVRGTDFVCNSYSDIGTSVLTFEGMVAITTPQGPSLETHPVMPQIKFQEIMPIAEMMDMARKYMQMTGDKFNEVHVELPPDLVPVLNEKIISQTLQFYESTMTVNLEPVLTKFMWEFKSGKWELIKAYITPVPLLGPKLINGELSKTEFVMRDPYTKEPVCDIVWAIDHWKLSCTSPMPCGFKQLADGTWAFECK